MVVNYHREVSMPGITLKNIPDALYQRLVDVARRHHRSLTKEILFALEQHVQQPSHNKAELLQRIREVRDRYPPNISGTDVDNWKGEGRP
jgi:plasmid stability protein